MGPALAVTDRLLIDSFRDDDAPALSRLGTAEVVRFLSGEAWTLAGAQASISLWRDIEARLGLTTWAMRRRDSRELIGSCGFAGTNVAWLRHEAVIEIGWVLGLVGKRPGLRSGPRRVARRLVELYP